MTLIVRKVCIFLMCMTCCLVAQAGDGNKKKQFYQHFPAWVIMMRDTNSAPGETERAFELFYKNEQPPIVLGSENIDNVAYVYFTDQFVIKF